MQREAISQNEQDAGSASERLARGSVGGRLYAAAETAAFLGKLNFLILLGCAAGGFLFGLAPAASAAATLCREQLRGVGGPALGRYFRAWRHNFIRANLLQAPGAIVILLLLLNATSIGATDGVLRTAFLVAAAVAFLYQVIVVTMDAHYDLRLRDCWVLAGRFMVSSPASPLLLAATLALLGVLTWLVPGLLPFFTLGAAAFFSTALCLSFFAANDRKVAA